MAPKVFLMPMGVLIKIDARKVLLGGEQHSGWLPEGFPIPPPTPIREVTMTFEIADNGRDGFLLIYASEDGSIHGDTWHRTIDEAKDSATGWFGIQKDEWKDKN